MIRASEIARRLGQRAEAVCLEYLPSGRRRGNYWHCGNVMGLAGESLYVHLSGERSGKWTDAATGEFGDLLDLIALNRRLNKREALQEAARFLRLPNSERRTVSRSQYRNPDAPQRLFAASKPIHGTLAENYLRSRGLVLPQEVSALRFHPRCFYRHGSRRVEPWPALIAAVTDNEGAITGAHRTWLNPGGGKAPLEDPRRAMGRLLGNGVRFGVAEDVVTAGEGIETLLALKNAMPEMPMIAALSAAHLAAVILPPSVVRLYVACDNDRAGRLALERLRNRFRGANPAVRALMPLADDFNTDLVSCGATALRHRIVAQLLPEDIRRFIPDPDCEHALD